ncbi:MAG: hypothetical protein IT208_01510 [Chthonomonadales bacterium]|nr:hypothetical protein [Chthonomonadales bacterium]
MDAPRIVCFSTPLLTTWVFDETHRILFDVGDGATAMLDSRIHKVRLAALTHLHRDHCAGLMQFLNLRGGAGDLAVLYPEGSGAGRALSGFLSSFDARSTGKVRWVPTGAGAAHAIEPERHFLRTFQTSHYPPTSPPRVMSLGYQVVRTVDKLKAEYRALPQAELDALRVAHGRAHITETVEDVLLSVTGDTMPLDPALYRGSRVLLHECTFLDTEESRDMCERGHPHSCLDEVLEGARDAAIGHLGLYHVSKRYEDAEALNRVRQRCAAMRIAFPVSVALPGRLYEDLLSQVVWSGA